MNFLALLSYAALCLFSYYKIRDIFSPDKAILVVLGVYFYVIFIEAYSIEYYLVYFSMLLAVMLAILVFSSGCESDSSLSAYKGNVYFTAPKGFHLAMWVASIPGILAQYYLILNFGGLHGYINNLAFRVVEFQGLGHLTVTIRSLYVINVIYFLFLVIKREKNIFLWSLWLFHLFLIIGFGVISAQRGRVLFQFLYLVIVLHYFFRKFKLHQVLLVSVVLIFSSSVMNVARSGFNHDGVNITTGLDGFDWSVSSLKFSFGEYGVKPLSLVLDGSDASLKLGSTYLSSVTNFVPRSIWPDKPESGGIVITNEYSENIWYGYSYLSTGLVPEAVINFGLAGYPLGVIMIFFLSSLLLVSYRKLLMVKRSVSILSFVILFSVYLSLWRSAMMFPTGEFANSVSVILISCFFSLYSFIVVVIVKKLFSPYLKAIS